MSTRLLLSMSVLAVLAACGGVPKQRFKFDAIDVAENPRPCLVVVNDDWAAAAEKNQVVNVADDDELVLEIEFPSAETVVTMAPLTVENGKVVRMPKSRKDARDYSGFVEELRKLRLRDPERQLFILPRKSANS
jgi:hypothetical protein